MPLPQDVLIDECDSHLADVGPWRVGVFSRTKARTYRYVCFMRGGRMHLLHRLITEAKAGQFVDHANGNTLDNRRCNLRVCTPSENCQNTRMRIDNTSGFKGVCFVRGKWRAEIRANGQLHRLGHFSTAQEAADAYARAALRLHGAFHNLG